MSSKRRCSLILCAVWCLDDSLVEQDLTLLVESVDESHRSG
jgi:hypothetical protein